VRLLRGQAAEGLRLEAIRPNFGMSGASHGTLGARVEDEHRRCGSVEGGNGWGNLGSKFQKAQVCCSARVPMLHGVVPFFY
jgi:hypothetical protein